MTNEKAIEIIEIMKKRLLPSMEKEKEAFDRATEGLKFIEENFPKTFEDYLNGEPI